MKVSHKITSHCTCTTMLMNLNINWNAWGENRAEHVYFSFIFSTILFSRLLVSRCLLLAVSCPQTENTRSTYASDAGADSRSWEVKPTVGGIRDREFKSTVFWIVLAISRISNQFTVQCPLCLTHWPLLRMFPRVLCQEPEALQWRLAASRLTAVLQYTMGGLFIDKLL